MFLSLWGDDEKYRQTYWTKFPGLYYPGDYALVDEEGYLWLLGRADDVLKVAGHRLGTMGPMVGGGRRRRRETPAARG